MKKVIYIFLVFISPVIIYGQSSDTSEATSFPKQYLSINPLNIALFQQVGVTYEYNPKNIGYEISAGFIYPNYQTYNNFFIAGPTGYGSLGDYSGFYVVPNVNVYLSKQKKNTGTGVSYISLQIVYKYMSIDSTRLTEWEGGDSGYYYLMNDKCNIFGGFVGLGHKRVFKRFFTDVKVGFGCLSVNHNMMIAGISEYDCFHCIDHYCPHKPETTKELNPSIHFSFKIGLAY